MDHLLEHEGDAVPTSGSASTSAAVGDAIDVDDEDTDAAALGIGADVEAKVRPRNPLSMSHPHSSDRASNVPSATRRFGTLPWPTFTPKRAGTINSRRVQKRYVAITTHGAMFSDPSPRSNR